MKVNAAHIAVCDDCGSGMHNKKVGDVFTYGKYREFCKRHVARNRKVELFVLLKNEKDTDNCVRAFENQINNLINLDYSDEKN